MATAPEMAVIFSASIENNLHTGCISRSQNNVNLKTTICDNNGMDGWNNGINSCEVSVKPKLEFHTDDQNCNFLSHDDTSLTNIDRQLPNHDINTEYNTIIDYQANFNNFIDSGCCSSQSTIDNGSNILPKEYVNDSKKDLFSINITHLFHPYIKNVNIEKNFTFDNEFKNNDLDSNCSGYNSSDFEFIDETEAKMFNVFIIDTDVNRSDISNEEASVNDSKDSNKSFNNYRNNLKADGDDFLVFFQTAAVDNFDVEHNGNFISSTNRPRLRFEMKFHECNDSEDDVRDAKETEKNIFSMYPRQNKYYKSIL